MTQIIDIIEVGIPGAQGAQGPPGNAETLSLADISDWPAGVLATEVAYLDGVTSAIQTQLDGKASNGHTHAIGDTTGLQVALDGKAASLHSHEIANVTGLQTALDGKASSSHTHTLDDLSDVLITTPSSGQVVRHNGSNFVNANLAASDMPSGIDAAKIGGGGVSNTEFGYLDGVTGAIQTQLEGKAASSHTHAAADITSGSLAAARLADGTATAGYVPISDGDGTSTWGAPSATDSSKLPTAGGTMTGAITLASTGINMTGTHVPATTDRCLTNWSGGNNIGLQAPSSGAVYLWNAGNSRFAAGSSMNSSFVAVDLSGAVARVSTTNGQLHSNSDAGAIIAEAGNNKYAAIAADNFSTVTNPAVMVWANGGTRLGAVIARVGMITRASNGTWTNVYYLGSTHRGDFYVYDSVGSGHCRIPINDTTLGSVVDNASGVTHVDSGSEAAGNVAWRISGAYLQINVGISVAANTKFGIEFRGGWS